MVHGAKRVRVIISSQVHLHASRPVNSNDLSIDPLAILAGKEAHHSCNIDWKTNTVKRTPCGGVLFNLLALWKLKLLDELTSSTPSSLKFAPLGIYSRQTLWYMSVLIPPGAMQLTVIFLSPISVDMLVE
jgi:hypothetical protein